MTTYTTHITIDASQEAIWPTLIDVTKWPEWTPTVDRLEVLDSAPLKLGNRYKLFQPKLRPAIWTVTLLEPPAQFNWEASLPGTKMVAEHILKPLGPDRTELILHVTFEGLVGKLISLLYGKLTESYVVTEGQSLKARVES